MKIRESKTYLKVLDHRKNCYNWPKFMNDKGGFCLECFGGGLTKYAENLINELHLEEVTYDTTELDCDVA